MKRVAETMTVSRSRLMEQVKQPAQGRPPRYSKAEDEVLLPLIRDIIDHRQTYGYCLVCAVLNRHLRQEGHASVNHKRVYRIMRLHGLLLASTKATGQTAATMARSSPSKAIFVGVPMGSKFIATAAKWCGWSSSLIATTARPWGPLRPQRALAVRWCRT